MATSSTDLSRKKFTYNKILNFSGPCVDVKLYCLDININDIRYWQERSEHFLTVQIFSDIDSCLTCIKCEWMDRIFLIVSDQFASSVLAKVEKIPQIISVFIFCKNPSWKNVNLTSYEKYRGIFYDKDNLLTEINDEIFRKSSVFPTMNVFQDEEIHQELFLDPHDMRLFSLLGDINEAARPLHQHDLMSCDKQQMIRECRLLFRNNERMLIKIDKFAENYSPTESIICYTETSFLYELINKVIRTQSTEVIQKFRFFIKNFEEMLDLLFAKQIFNQWSSSSESTGKFLTVYRGQLLSPSDLKKLQSFIGKNMMIGQYLSTTQNIQVAQMYAGEGEDSPKLESVLYHIDISNIYENYIDQPDPSIYYYDISHISKMPDEEEVLLRIGTTFKVINIEKLSDHRWHVYLRFEKVNDYRSKNKINRTPIEIVQSFFRKASQKQKINVEDIIDKHLSSDIILKISIFIRLGHLVKHHPQEQLQYYQYALCQIPSNESILLQIGYWAIRTRCIFSVNDWRFIPLNIYRQTVVHIQGNLKQKLHDELTRIEVARAAKWHYNEVSKSTDNYSEQQIILDENDQLKILLQSDEVAYRCLYAGILTTGERGIIDYYCRMFYQSIDTASLSEDFSFANILPNVDLNEHYQLLNQFFNNIRLDSTDLSSKHIFIVSLTDKPFILKIQTNLTIGQLKEKIRSNLEIPCFVEYDFRLIHLGKTLIDEEKLMSDYHINDQCIIHLIYGPSEKNKPVTGLDQEFQENTGLTVNLLKHISLVEERRLKKIQTQLQLHAFPSLSGNSHAGNSRLDQFLKENLHFSQYDDDENDADPADLLDMSDSLADQYFQNSGPQTSASEMMDLISRRPYQLNSGQNNNNQQISSDDLHDHGEQIKDIRSNCITS